MDKLPGIERVVTFLQSTIYQNYEKYKAVPQDLASCNVLQETIRAMTLGQLLTMAHLQDRLKTLKIHGMEADQNINVTIAGCFGQMDTEGFIHT